MEVICFDTVLVWSAKLALVLITIVTFRFKVDGGGIYMVLNYIIALYNIIYTI